MSEHNETGKKGEELARHHLVQNGYEILDINWQYMHKEIDIVARKNKTMVFVEVKTRASLNFELPKEAVTIRKQKNLVFAADAYLQEYDIDLPSRFDIVSVYAQEPPKILEHLKDAFSPHELI